MMVMVMQLKMLEDWTFEDHEYLALVLNVFTLQTYDLVIYVWITLCTITLCCCGLLYYEVELLDNYYVNGTILIIFGYFIDFCNRIH